MDAAEVFATNLRAERDRKGLSQFELYHASGVHFTEISRLERGDRDPRLSTIARLAAGLGVPAARLLRGID